MRFSQSPINTGGLSYEEKSIYSHNIFDIFEFSPNCFLLQDFAIPLQNPDVTVTACATYTIYSADPPVAIPDNQIGSPVYAYINNVKTPDNKTFVGASFGCSITHTYSGDLEVYIGYAGEEVRIWNREGGSFNDIMIPPEKPNGLVLTWGFNATDFNTSRTWYLRVGDGAAGDIGTINMFYIRISYSTGLPPYFPIIPGFPWITVLLGLAIIVPILVLMKRRKLSPTLAI